MADQEYEYSDPTIAANGPKAALNVEEASESDDDDVYDDPVMAKPEPVSSVSAKEDQGGEKEKKAKKEKKEKAGSTKVKKEKKVEESPSSTVVSAVSDTTTSEAAPSKKKAGALGRRRSSVSTVAAESAVAQSTEKASKENNSEPAPIVASAQNAPYINPVSIHGVLGPSTTKKSEIRKGPPEKVAPLCRIIDAYGPYIDLVTTKTAANSSQMQHSQGVYFTYTAEKARIEVGKITVAAWLPATTKNGIVTKASITSPVTATVYAASGIVNESDLNAKSFPQIMGTTNILQLKTSTEILFDPPLVLEKKQTRILYVHIIGAYLCCDTTAMSTYDGDLTLGRHRATLESDEPFVKLAEVFGKTGGAAMPSGTTSYIIISKEEGDARRIKQKEDYEKEKYARDTERRIVAAKAKAATSSGQINSKLAEIEKVTDALAVTELMQREKIAAERKGL